MPGWDDNDDRTQRRRFARRPVQLSARLRVGDDEMPALIENISPGGAFLRVALPASAREVVASIGLPQGRNLHVRAKVRWRRHGEAEGVGVEFENFLADANELR